MTEYIERERAMQIAFTSPFFSNALMEEIKVIPAADVAPVIHAHWIRQDESFTRFKCSNPECSAENFSGFENYCPNCGAKMDKNCDCFDKMMTEYIEPKLKFKDSAVRDYDAEQMEEFFNEN